MGSSKPEPDELDSDEKEGTLFPPTRWSLVLRTIDQGTEEEALGELCRIYWSPIYFYIRTRGNDPSDAEDLTQGFFSQMLRREQLQHAAENTRKGKLRSYLLTSVQNFLINQHQAETAQKRGGGVVPLRIDVEESERQFTELPSSDRSPDEIFDLQWANTVLQRAFLRLESEYSVAGKDKEYEILKMTLGQTAKQVPFSELANRLGISSGAARVAAFRIRKQFRAVLQEEIRETAASADDWEEELAYFRVLLAGH